MEHTRPNKLKNGNIKKAFLLKSKADRKKLQEALKKLGLYQENNLITDLRVILWELVTDQI